MPTEKDVQEALLRMVESGRVVASDISKQGISEICVEQGGNTLHVSWYPSYGLFSPETLRSLSFNGQDAPLSTQYAEPVLRAMLSLAERQFDEHAEKILESYPKST